MEKSERRAVEWLIILLSGNHLEVAVSSLVLSSCGSHWTPTSFSSRQQAFLPILHTWRDHDFLGHFLSGGDRTANFRVSNTLKAAFVCVHVSTCACV